MKLTKRIIAMVLCLLMISSGTVNVLATENPDIVVAETPACAECSQTEGHLDTCSLNVAPASTGCAECGEAEGHLDTCSEYVAPPSPCPTCGVEGCTSGHENWCVHCKVDNCGLTHVKCDKCLTTDCKNPHEQWCEHCRQDNCGKTHVVCDECSTVDGHLDACTKNAPAEPTKCDLCSIENGHAEGCPAVTPCATCGQLRCAVIHENWCAVCNTENCGQTHVTCDECTGVDGHNEGCSKKETTPVGCEECKQPEGHLETCSKWTCATCQKNPCECPPAESKEVCEHCGVELAEGNEHAADCLSLCTCDPKPAEGEEHNEECPLHQLKPVSEIIAEDGNTIKVNGIPEDAALQVSDPSESDLDEIMGILSAQYGGASTFSLRHRPTHLHRRTEKVVKELFSYDISVLNAEGEEWQPGDEPVTITLKIPEMKVNAFQKICIAHMHDGEVSIIDADYDVTEETVSFTTDGFSTFYGFIVDFEYNGYKFSINGGSEVMLSELMEKLGIDHQVSSVSDVDFSNEALISIERENGDWKLKSLKAFGTEEWLDIYFSDGTVIEVKVTDPVLYYYLDGTDAWNMETFNSVITKITGDDPPSNAVTINDDAITGKSLGATHDNGKDGTVVYDVLIYAHPGMAIRFDRYSTFSNVTFTNGLYWTFGTDNNMKGDEGYNYVIIPSNIQTVTESTFKAKIGDHGDNGSSYVDCEIKIIIVPEWSRPTLLKNALNTAPENIKNTYSIREVPVTLYNYDGNKYKNKYSSEGEFFSFSGVSKGVEVTVDAGNLTAKGHANGGGPILGIFQDTLQGEEKLPVMAEGYNIDLFSSTAFDGKEIRNVQFEFIYDTEGYYTYSSNVNHAQLSADGTKVQLYREAMGTTASYALNGSDTNYAAGGFYPYSDINKAAGNAGNVLSWDTWQDRLASGYVKEAAPFGMDLVASSTKATPYSTVDMHNGLQLATSFYLPADKKTPTGKEIVYQFTGDDDLWVFIDDKLTLDIGGGHGPVNGTINFTTGQVSVEGIYYTLNDSTEKNNYTKTFSFEGDKIHTLKIFYLERYAGVSNCRMRFNVPIVPEESVSISKSLRNQDDKDFENEPDVAYKFQVLVAKDDDRDVDADKNAFNVLKDAPYTILYNDSTTKELHTDANDGTFTLAEGEQAFFGNIPRFYEVKVVEVAPDDGYTYLPGKVSVNGGAEQIYNCGDETSPIVLLNDTGISFAFTNKMQTEDIIITKKLDGNLSAVNNATDNSVTKKFAFNLTVKNPKNPNLNHLIENFELNVDETKTFKDVPVGLTYTVTEFAPTAPSGYRYDPPKFNDAPIAFDTNNKATLTKIVKVTPPDENNPNVVNVMNTLIAMYGNLTITKNGIQSVDHHEASGTDKQEQQSSVFHINGESDAGDPVNLEVVIVGNKSITIKQIPVGTYNVTEITGWSWRYDLSGVQVEKGESTTITNGTTVTVTPQHNKVTFTNERDRVLWLSGDNYLKNLFNGKTVNNP